MLSDRLPARITLWMVYLCQLPQYLQGHTQTPFLSWYYLNSWLWTSGTTFNPTGPWHSLSILLAHPLSFCSANTQPAPLHLHLTHHRGIRRDPPSAAHCRIHTPSPPCSLWGTLLRVGTCLPSCGSCAFFSPAFSRFPSSGNHFPQHTGTLQ